MRRRLAALLALLRRRPPVPTAEERWDAAHGARAMTDEELEEDRRAIQAARDEERKPPRWLDRQRAWR